MAFKCVLPTLLSCLLLLNIADAANSSGKKVKCTMAFAPIKLLHADVECDYCASIFYGKEPFLKGCNEDFIPNIFGDLQIPIPASIDFTGTTYFVCEQDYCTGAGPKFAEPSNPLGQISP